MSVGSKIDWIYTDSRTYERTDGHGNADPYTLVGCYLVLDRALGTGVTTPTRQIIVPYSASFSTQRKRWLM